MLKFQPLKWIVIILLFLSACRQEKSELHQRPIDPWAFRSVLDKQPRMLTLALDTSCYVAYDLVHCTLYKAWKGGVLMEGAPYTDKKNVQPTTYGKAYYSDSLHQSKWVVESDGKAIATQVINKGYTIKSEKIYLSFQLILNTEDTIRIEEHPEFKLNKGKPGLERVFKTSGVPANFRVLLFSSDSIIHLKSNTNTEVITYWNSFPHQDKPEPGVEYDHRGRYWIEKSSCTTCHEVDKSTVGPSFNEIAKRYPHDKSSVAYLTNKIRTGGSGVWGTTAMIPHPNLADKEIEVMLDYIFSLVPVEEVKQSEVSAVKPKKLEEVKQLKPGHGAPLVGVHPSYNLSTIHTKDFKPRVGGLAFLPDGRLLVTTWDITGGVYLLSGVETGDSSRVTVKRIASGLAEPLGITVVDGIIYVLQKQELTKLIDEDGDEVIDTYETVCDRWGVTGDFHEFAFGLVYKDGYFYATLSMAMRLLSNERQKPDRGKTIKIGKDGSYEWINYGLRTPNGIGIGIDNEIFVTDNQGEWVPGNKVIHVKKNEYHGMRWGLPDSITEIPKIASPAIWLPEDEIGNSPSEPVLVMDGPYKGQLLHGDVTHGGIKRDYLENVNGEYQGAVFRFSQGLEAGINRMRWGPDGALYVGGVGMVGGWSWNEKQFGLQRLEYNGKTTFEMLAVKAQPNGFEIEFTEPIQSGLEISSADILIQQWWYLPTARYGGPKLDLEKMEIARLSISPDRLRINLEIPDLKKGHVIYFRLPEALRSESGNSLWSSEAWYTLNQIPN